MIMSDLTERGLELFSEIRGAERAAQMRDAISGGGFGSALTALAVDFVFGSIWTRSHRR
jgi:4-carboxymuconolactone decarboxylase